MIASAGRTGKQQEQQQKPELHPSQKKSIVYAGRTWKLVAFFLCFARKLHLQWPKFKAFPRFSMGGNSRNIYRIPSQYAKVCSTKNLIVFENSKKELKESLFCLQNGASFSNCQPLNGANFGKSKQKQNVAKLH